VGKSTVVSVKSSKVAKRKVDEAGSGRNDVGGSKAQKKKKKEKLSH
jgi:hypothetical protein